MSNKFRINENNEVKPCEAIKVQCKFGSDSDGNHFSNKTDATQEADKRLTAQYGVIPTIKSTESKDEKSGREYAEEAIQENLNPSTLRRFATDSGSDYDKGYIKALDSAIAEKDLKEYTAQADTLHSQFLTEADPIKKEQLKTDRDYSHKMAQNARRAALGLNY